MTAFAILLAAVSSCRAAPDYYRESHRFEQSVSGVHYTVVFREPTEGHHGGQLDIYAGKPGHAKLVYTHPGALSTPALDDDQPPRRFSSVLADGSSTLVYRMSNELGATSKLYVLRLEKGRFSRFGPFPEGRLLEDDGAPEIIASEPPPGTTMIRCEEFHTDAGSARQTKIFAWDGKRFADVSLQHPDFYEKRLAGDRQALTELRGERLRRPSAYAGAALTLYFDEKAAGHPREAWRHLDALIDSDADHPAVRAWSHGKECVEKLRADVRQRLQIPADW